MFYGGWRRSHRRVATFICCMDNRHTSTSMVRVFHHTTAAAEKEGIIAQHRPRAILRPPPGCSQVLQVGHLLNLCLVKHIQRGDSPLVLQAASHCWLSCCCSWICLPLLLLLLLALVLLPMPQLLVS